MEFKPQITSHLPSITVHSRLLLVTGVIVSENQNLAGLLSVIPHNQSFPPQFFPVAKSCFKALLHLTQGDNDDQVQRCVFQYRDVLDIKDARIAIGTG